MKFYLDHMVSLHCIQSVKDDLVKLGHPEATVRFGEIEIRGDISAFHYLEIKQILKRSGFELLQDKKMILIQKVKNAIVSMVQESEPLIENLSVYLSAKLDYDYNYLSNLFSDKQGITIEKFYIHCKIGRVKELVLFGGLSLTEIAYRLHYSSVGHLSNQFKKVTGMTPSAYKKQSRVDDDKPEDQ